MTWIQICTNFTTWFNAFFARVGVLSFYGITLGDIIVSLIAIDLLCILIFGFKFLRED